jgi:hypothetical protein
MKDWTGRNQHSIYSTLGASNHSDYERSERDYYATHPSAIKALIENVDISDIWENACGELHLVKPLRKAGYTVYATDIVERKERIDAEIDFLTSDKKWGGDILTNPPYKYAQEWVEKSMDVLENGRLLCMFLKLTFLEGMKRRKMFEQFPPREVLVYSKRMPVARNGDKEMFNRSSAACYAWFVWEKGFNGNPIIKWI